MIREIELGLLRPHPEQCNYMKPEMLGKLRRHIEQTGNYEPLTVRPHPWEEGKFQVINGHNRLRVLRAIGYSSANCDVWNIDAATAQSPSRSHAVAVPRCSLGEIPGTQGSEHGRHNKTAVCLWLHAQSGGLAESLPRAVDWGGASATTRASSSVKLVDPAPPATDRPLWLARGSRTVRGERVVPKILSFCA